MVHCASRRTFSISTFTDSTAMSATAGNRSSFSRSTTSSTARTVSPAALTTNYFRATSHAARERSAVTHRGDCTEPVPEPVLVDKATPGTLMPWRTRAAVSGTVDPLARPAVFFVCLLNAAPPPGDRLGSACPIRVDVDRAPPGASFPGLAFPWFAQQLPGGGVVVEVAAGRLQEDCLSGGALVVGGEVLMFGQGVAEPPPACGRPGRPRRTRGSHPSRGLKAHNDGAPLSREAPRR